MHYIVIPTILLNPVKEAALDAAVSRLGDSCAEPFELIVICSGTETYKAYFNENARVANVPRQLSYAQAVNQGLRLHEKEIAAGDTVTVHNDDAQMLVYGWDKIAREQLLTLRTVGVVSHPENTDPVDVLRFGFRHFSGAVWTSRYRDVVDLGFLDEGYLLGTFEDTDLWERMDGIGLTGLTDFNVPVMHEQNLTGRFMPAFKAQEKRNKALFVKKWGVDPMEKYH